MTKKLLATATLFLIAVGMYAQVTSATINGSVNDKNGEALAGATVVATHLPSGTRYGTVTNGSGRYNLPAVRVGGPFSVVVSYTGYESQTQSGIQTTLGNTTNVTFQLAETGVVIGDVVVSANRSNLFSSDRTGAASTFAKEQIVAVPVIGSRSISEITKYNPNGNGRSFGGQDSRLNNFTVDGSVFNNGFGLGSDANAGGRTGTTPISLDAIEEIQVNVAPFDVRQSGFTGSGINAVTRSGTNEFSGSVYYSFRDTNDLFIGKTNYNGGRYPITSFDNKVIGARIGGALIKNKLFFFASGEIERRIAPATPFVANGSTLAGVPTRVLKTDLDELSKFLKDKYNYETGPYEGFDNETVSDKFLIRLDYNVNDKNKLTLRYTHHNSVADIPVSNSNSLGFGNRTLNTDAMAYQNSGYLIGDNTRSIVAELNTTIGDRVHNSFIAGYDFQDENRQYKGDFFPTIDILNAGKTYIGAGFDPFTPSNKLSYGTLHFTDNVTIYRDRHTITAGVNYENYKSDNLFFPGSNGVYVFNSLADFYAAANSTADTSPVKLNLFQFRYSALENAAEPLQTLKANRTDVYLQDEFQVAKNFKLTAGLRASAIWFDQSSLSNPTVDNQDYIDNDGNRGYKITTGQLPGTKILYEPRLGFNWDVFNNRSTQIRGGSGIFTGRPPFVFLSNQIGNNGVLTGFIQQANTTKYKFTPDASIFIPDTPTLPTTFDIAATDADFKYPQVWKTNFAIDQKLPGGLVLSAEFLYNKNLNATNYFDANLEPATANFTGVDTRPRFPGSGLTGTNFNNAVRINDNISRAAILNSVNAGGYKSATFKLEYPQRKGLYGMVAYTYSEARNLMGAGSIASGSFTSARSTEGNNKLQLAFADQDIPHRIVALLNYRLQYGGKLGGATQFSLGYVGEVSNRVSYAYAGDMNGDGVTNNDLMWVPLKGSDMTFEQFTVPGDTFTIAEQQAALDAFIDQDPYLSTRRGQYAERNGLVFPWLHRFDFSVAQDFHVTVGGKVNAVQVRFDILNAGNLINNEWGVGYFLTADRPMTYRSVNTAGVPTYRMATQVKNGKTILLTDTFQRSTALSQAWTAQLTVRYTFN
jgi:hypothetical protein